ncbi:MAG: hypothetical protein U1F43_11545 [Myxococcota bacterium]
MPAAEVLRWAHGGDGVALVEGRVVFVAGAVPGDVVDLAVVEDRGRWARAELRRLVRPSPERVASACPVQARCGGCPWMLGSLAAQAASREAILRGEVKKRLGDGVPVEMAPASGTRAAWATASACGSPIATGAWSYLGKGSHDLVDIPAAPSPTRASRPRCRRCAPRSPAGAGA